MPFTAECQPKVGWQTVWPPLLACEVRPHAPPANTLAHRFAVMWHSCTELAMLAPKVQVLGKLCIRPGNLLNAPTKHPLHMRPTPGQRCVVEAVPFSLENPATLLMLGCRECSTTGRAWVFHSQTRWWPFPNLFSLTGQRKATTPPKPSASHAKHFAQSGPWSSTCLLSNPRRIPKLFGLPY